MKPEEKIRADLAEYLENRRWMVEITHGNAYQRGFPDLFVAHKKFGTRWIDTKVEGKYSFTKAQKTKWPIWEQTGVGIWILTGATQEQYDRLFKPPNWRNYWRASWGDLPDLDALIQELRNEVA